MPHLYVATQGASLHKRGDRLEVRKESGKLYDTPVRRLTGVVLLGNVQASTQVLRHLVERGVEVCLMTLAGRLVARVEPPLSRNVFLRVTQYQRAADPVYTLATGRAIVSAKVHGEVDVLAGYQANHPEPEALATLAELRHIGERALSGPAIDDVRGLEGLAARTYYRALRVMVRTGLRFDERSRRPPLDPVNALLSLGYVLVAQRLHGLLEAAGLDPFVGFLHALHYGRPSLAADLIEEFRAPCVDRFTLNLVNQKTVQATDFVTDPDRGGVRLTEEAAGRYFEAFERHVQGREKRDVYLSEAAVAWEERWRRQAAAMARAVADGRVYEPSWARE